MKSYLSASLFLLNPLVPEVKYNHVHFTSAKIEIFPNKISIEKYQKSLDQDFSKFGSDNGLALVHLDFLKDEMIN